MYLKVDHDKSGIYLNRGIIKRRRDANIILQERGATGRWKFYMNPGFPRSPFIGDYEFKNFLLDAKEELRQRAISIAELEFRERMPIFNDGTKGVRSS